MKEKKSEEKKETTDKQKNKENENSKKEEKPKTEPKKPEEAPITKKPTLGFTFNEYKKRFNKFSNELGIGYDMSSVQVKQGSVQNVAQYSLTENVAMIFAMDKKSNEIREISLVAQGSTEKEIQNILIGIGMLIQATNPSLNVTERGEILGELGLKDGSFATKKELSTIRNNVKYTLSLQEGLGLFIYVNHS